MLSKTSFFKLKNIVKHYDWGSPDWIPQLLGLPNISGEPWAELWMGVHPEGPSEAEIPGEDPISGAKVHIGLPELISRDPDRCLGREAAREFGGLPFLYKLLAAGKPLSIQAHPNREQAEIGWERENALGIPLKAPKRNYKDPNHKPEILCALGPFTAMAGFREPADIIKRLKAFGFSPLAPLIAVLETGGTHVGGGTGEAGGTAAGGLRTFLGRLFSLPLETRREMGEYALSRRAALQAAYPEYAGEWEYTACFAELYPEDPAVIAPLYLNFLNLNPGEAIYIPAGVLHAYVRGFGVELMANSDNVLRGGLTPKHIDVEELMGILRFVPYCPEILHPGTTPLAPIQGPSPLPVSEGLAGITRYSTPCREFLLSRISRRGGELRYRVTGPAILIVTQGELTLGFDADPSDVAALEPLILKPGESAFIAPSDRVLLFSGEFTLYMAGIGPDPAESSP